jgi:hypothetical protein
MSVDSEKRRDGRVSCFARAFIPSTGGTGRIIDLSASGFKLECIGAKLPLIGERVTVLVSLEEEGIKPARIQATVRWKRAEGQRSISGFERHDTSAEGDAAYEMLVNYYKR